MIRGHNVMKGYWNRPEATAESIDDDGWFKTGDMATVDEDGYFFIVDRKKDLIIRGGYNVYPREIEEVIYEHPAVREAAVVGVPHDDLGEEVGAAVALKDGAECTEDEHPRARARSRSPPTSTRARSGSSTSCPRARPARSSSARSSRRTEAQPGRLYGCSATRDWSKPENKRCPVHPRARRAARSRHRDQRAGGDAELVLRALLADAAGVERDRPDGHRRGRHPARAAQLGSVDPGPDPADYQWGSFDALVADAARNRIEVLPFLFGTPSWVARDLDGPSCGDCTLYAPRGDAALAAWSQFVGDTVDRYGPDGQFWVEHPSCRRRRSPRWQIWNEQNSKSFYRPRPTVKGYAKLLDGAATAIRARDPAADVVLGGMAELAGSRKAVPGPEFLHELYGGRARRRTSTGSPRIPTAPRSRASGSRSTPSARR